jgi:putative peptidoglycan binding protein
MKTTKLLSLAITALVALGATAWAGPHGGGGGGNFGGGGFGGGHGGGGFRGGGFGGGHFGGAGVGGFNGGGIRAAPAFSGTSPRFSGNADIGGLNRAPQRFSYYSGARTSAAVPRASARQLPNRSMSSTAGRVASVNRQPNRMNAAVGQKRIANQRFSTAENRQAFVKNHAVARHDGNWHRSWDRHQAHFDHGRVFVFVNGFWWGLYPWDYYPYYGYGNYPYDYSYDYPYDYSGYPYDGANYSSSQPYSYYDGYAPSGQYSNTSVGAVQSKLTSLGYYHGAIDGVLGDQTEAALARYQQDQDISVTGTVTSATLQELGLPYSGL